MKIAIIAALADGRVIGDAGGIPWHLSDDLRRFKRLTTGHALLMGRKTFESIGRPLPHRRNVVVSHRAVPGVEHYPSIPQALEALQDAEIVFVIGGGELYAQMLERADLLYLTIVHRTVSGDTVFPAYEHMIGSAFRLVAREEHEGFVYEDYERITS